MSITRAAAAILAAMISVIVVAMVAATHAAESETDRASPTCGPDSDEPRDEPLAQLVARSDVDRENAIITLRLAEDQSAASIAVYEHAGGQRRRLAGQLDFDDPSRLVWISPGRWPPGEERRFDVERITSGTPAKVAVDVALQDGTIIAQCRGRPVLVYHVDEVDPPEGIDPSFRRSGYIHPVWTPAGAVVTDHFPSDQDHYHQDGVWLAWSRTRYGNRQPNFWELKGGGATVRCSRLVTRASGEAYGELTIEHEFVDRSVNPEQVVLNETWQVRVWNVGESDADYWVWDLRSVQQPATTVPLELLHHPYGGLGVRGANQWQQDRCRFLTSEGLTRADGNASRPRWCAMSGTIDDRPAGIAVMCHPENERSPQPVRVHPTMPYFCYAPVALGDWILQPNTQYRLVYRVVAFDGEPDAELLERLWRDFATPVAIQPRR